MKKKIITVFIIILTAAIALAATLYILPSKHEKECKTRVYSDMQEKLDTVKDSVIGVIPVTEEDGNISYGGGGSGVIFKQKDNTYYALTAAHCVDNSNSTYKVYTTKTEYAKEDISSDLLDIADNSFYESMADAKIEYIADDTDIAIISFTSKDSLTVAKLAKSDPAKDDHVMCIGNPEVDQFIVTYGKITSSLQTITSTSKTDKTKRTYDVLEHDAYIYFGNSGGPAFNEDMEVAGINTAGSMNILGIFNEADMVPCSIFHQCVQDWKTES